MPAPKPAERQLVARLAAHESWARTPNRTARTAPARDAFLAKFDHLVDPEGVLSPEERGLRAANARKAHFSRLALKSAQARRASSSRRQALEELTEVNELLASAIAVSRESAVVSSHQEVVRPTNAATQDLDLGDTTAVGDVR